MNIFAGVSDQSIILDKSTILCGYIVTINGQVVSVRE